MKAGLTFTTLGADILHLIVGELEHDDHQSARNLALVSRLCKALVDPLLNRSIEFSYQDDKIRAVDWKSDRLSSLENTDLNHVKIIKVSDLPSDGKREVDLAAIVRSLSQLQELSWESENDIPEAVISTLERRWPDSKLIVRSQFRNHATSRLWLSPLLHDLSFDILIDSRYSAARSKLPELRNVLCMSRRLQRLDIKTEYGFIRATQGAYMQSEPRAVNMPLQQSDRLPTLRELRISGPGVYNFSNEHCKLWRNCMDWTQIHTLDLGSSCPQHFFEEIGDQLRSLKILTIGISTGEERFGYGPRHMTCMTLEPIKDFIASTESLHELHVTDFDNVAEVIVPIILNSQKSLQVLGYHTSMGRPYSQVRRLIVWTPAQLEALYSDISNLSDLMIDFPLENGNWPQAYATIVATFSRIRRLKVIVELNRDASDFSAKYHQDVYGSVTLPPLNDALAREVTEGLFKDFFKYNSYARLHSLEVCFIRKEEADRGQTSNIEFPFKIVRSIRDDAPSPSDGGYELFSPGKWLRGWSDWNKEAAAYKKRHNVGLSKGSY